MNFPAEPILTQCQECLLIFVKSFPESVTTLVWQSDRSRFVQIFLVRPRVDRP